MSRLESLARGSATGTVLRTVTVADPAAGADWSITPDNGRAWEVLSVFGLFVASSNAADRTPTLFSFIGGVPLWGLPVQTSIVADASQPVGWLARYAPLYAPAATAPQVNGLPETFLLPGYALTMVTAGIDASDQWSHVVAQVLETSTGEREYARTIAGNLAGRAEAIADILTGDV